MESTGVAIWFKREEKRAGNFAEILADLGLNQGESTFMDISSNHQRNFDKKSQQGWTQLLLSSHEKF